MDFSRPDDADLSALPLPPSDVPCVAAVAHFSIGDIINATMSVAALKKLYPDCLVVFFTSVRFGFVLDNNPDIDCLIALEGEPHLLASLTPRLRQLRPWVRFLEPLAYVIHDDHAGMPILPMLRAYNGVPIEPGRRSVIQLRPEEVAAARNWWSALPEGPTILIETEFNSGQTPWDESFLWAMAEALAHGGAFFVFSALNKPGFLDAFQARYPRSIWADVPFRWNIEFYEQASAFIGVSSGISVAIATENRNLDKPWIEVSTGPVMSHGFYGQYRSLQVCHSKQRFLEAIERLADRLYRLGGKPIFSPRFSPAYDSYGLRHNCACCGATGAVGVHGRRIRECLSCGFIFNAAPDTGAAEECRYREGEHGKLLSAVLAVGLPVGHDTVLDFSGCVDDVPPGLRHRRLDASDSCWVTSEDIAENSAAAIIAPDVLASIPTPFEWMEQANFALAEDGLLLLRVPHADSAEAQTRQSAWPPFRTPGVRHFFKRWFLDGLAFQTGFAVERCWTETPPASVAACTEIDEAVRGDSILYVLRKRGPTQYRVRASGGL